MKIKILKTPIFLKDFAGAWVFYTILPSLPLLKAEFIRIARFAPLVGIIIGLFQSIIWFGLSHLNWPKESITLIALSAGYLFTGGLHLDGLMDTADGIAAGEKKCLEAMRDSRVGASGIQAFVLILLFQIASLLKLGTMAPFIFPIANFWGRVAPLWAIEKFEYLHKDGTGSFHKKNWKGYKKEIKPTLFILSILSIYLLFYSIQNLYYIKLIILIWSGIIPAMIIPSAIGRKLGGHSGDSYGASVVLVETFILFLFSMIL